MSKAASMNRFRVSGMIALAVLVGAASNAHAQRIPVVRDSARGIPQITLAPNPPADSLIPPLTPRRAFLSSFFVPGYGQAVLGRPKAASLFLFVEALSLSMIRESAAELNEARRTANDTIVVSWVDPSGQTLPKPSTRPWVFNDSLVRSRRAHMEDWIALLVGNHLFAGADAFVAAHLWDVPARLGFRMLPGRRAMLRATIEW
jgi:hypothetical protein